MSTRRPGITCRGAIHRARGQKPFHQFLLLTITTFAWALIPGDLSVRDPLIPALYHTESFEGQNAHVPNTLQDTETKLETLIQSDPANAEAHRALAEINVKQLDFAAAETHMKLYVAKSTAGGDRSKTGPYLELQEFYTNRLMFDRALTTMQQHAAALPAHEWDVPTGAGKYALYRKMMDHISRYGLSTDVRSIYLASIQAYPSQQQPHLDYIEYLKKSSDQKAALEAVEKFKNQFPADTNTYLLTKASLLPAEDAFDFMNRSFDPLWNQEIYRAFDGYLTGTEKKRDYLNSLKDRLQKNRVDADAAVRLFQAYHHAGNLMEAQNTLNDFRLMKENQVREKKSSWSSKELYWMASLNQRILNYNEAARYYYALYSRLNYKREPGLSPDTALHGLFSVLMAAEERPVQLSAGNLDYYKDIAAMDQNPGVLNGILSLILNGTDPQGQFQAQEDKAHGYFNRAEAMRLVRYTQKHFPESKHLPQMYTDSLRIFERYGMDKLLVEAGEDFFQQFGSSAELLQVGIAVTDAYARLKDHESEWKTYQRLLPVAAERNRAPSLIATRATTEEEYLDDQPKPGIDYEFLLKRYIASLTNQGKHLEVVRLYQQEIRQHPDDEALYENFAAYLTQNQLFEEEKKLYEQAISRFQQKGWYEKLARWYLRFKREQEYEQLSKQIMDIFRGTEIESYLQQTGGSSQQLYVALNLYAHEKFPLNTQFVRNLLNYYNAEHLWERWEALSEEYYFLDEAIAQDYLKYLSRSDRLPPAPDPSNAISTRFAGDVAAWKSHFEEAATLYDKLGKTYPADVQINGVLADLKRSLGVQDVQNYHASAVIREHLAKINPSNSALWTSAGETMADIELYDESRRYWEQILKIDPYNPDRAIELATIYWDYYLFDDALNTIARIRSLKKDDLLFAYEAGAIYESKRDYKKAIAEYAKSLDDHSEMAWTRLGELYQRKRYTDQIQKHLDAHLQKDRQNERFWTGVIRFYVAQQQKELARAAIAQALDTLKPEPFRKIADSLTQTARDLGFNDLQEQLFKRQTEDAASDVERWNQTLLLARFYEANQQSDQAEAVYRRLYNDQPRSAGIIQELVSYYWRSKQYDEAFDVYKKALGAANPAWKKRYLAEVANKYRERKDFSSALVYAKELLNAEPLNSQHFQRVAELLAEQKDYAALAAHYHEGLKRVQEAQITPEEKKQRIAALRRGIVQANVILKDYTAALDQYIEIINRDAESEEGLKEAAGFASKYGLNQRLFDYYSKTAAGSPKDHRWPMVLGRLHVYTGDFQAAIQQFQTAIAIRPERSDFYQQAAESYQRLGQYEQAILQYEKAYEISFKNKRWLLPIAELHARLGRKEKALALYAETLKELTPMQYNFALTRQSLAWGEMDRAVAYGKTGLDLYFKDPQVPFPLEGFQDYLEALIRSGKQAESFAILRRTSDRITTALNQATFESEELRSAQYMVRNVFSNNYPELLKKYFLEEDWQRLQQTILDQITRNGGYNRMVEQVVSEYLPLVRTAKMGPAEERLLRDLTTYYRKLSPAQTGEEWSRYLQWRSQLISFYTRRHAYAQAATWMETELNTYKHRADHRYDLIRMAELFRLAEMPDRELSVLRKYYQYGVSHDLQPEPVHRYLDLLYQRNLTEELKRAAATANLISANYFLHKRDEGLSIIAIQTLHARFKNDPSWQSIQLAMVGWQIRKPSDFFDANFTQVLDLRPIGDLLDRRSEATKTLEGDPWFYYGKSYGQYLYWTDRKAESAYHLPADLEGLPTAAVRQDQLGTFYLNEGRLEQALQHFTLALQLDPGNAQSTNRRARTLLQLGRKQEAIDLYKALIEAEQHRKNASVWLMYLRAAGDYDFLPSVRNEIREFITARVRETGSAGNAELLELYLRGLDKTAQVEQIRAWIEAAPAPLDFGQSLLGYRFGTEVDFAIYATVNRYLDRRILQAAGQEQSMVRNDFWRWNEPYAKDLIDLHSYAEAAAILATVQEKFESSEDSEIRFAIALLRAKALALSAKQEDAWTSLQQHLKNVDENPDEDRYRRAIEMLKGTTLENRLKEEMYSRLLASGRTEDAIYAGLAEVKLQNNKLAEANELLRKMIYLQSENLDGFHSAAELLEKYQHWNEAIQLRQELAKRKRWDEKNLAFLAQDHLNVDQNQEAAKIAAAVIVSPSATSGDRSTAAVVYARAATNSIGPAELVTIQKSVRGSAGGLRPALAPYAHNLRRVVLEQNEAPPSELVRAEMFLNPDDPGLRISLFLALVREGKCLQALETLDPDQERKGTYISRQRFFGRSEEHAYDDYSNHPVERLQLSEEKTKSMAIQMAECAKKEGDFAGELFFLQMAMAHTAVTAGRDALNTQIETLERRIEQDAEKESANHTITFNIGRNP